MTEIDQQFLQTKSLDDLGGDPAALASVAWDTVEISETPTSVVKTGVLGSELRTISAEPKEPVPPTIGQEVEDGISYDVETRPDGSRWLLGRSGGPRGASVRLSPPVGPDAEAGAQGGVQAAQDKPGEPGAPKEAGSTTGVVADVGAGVLHGINDAAMEVLRTTRLDALGDWLQEKFPLPTLDVPEPQTGAGQAAQGVSQAIAGIVPAARITRALGAVSGFLRWTTAGALTDFAAFSPDDPGIGDLAAQLGKLDQPILEEVRAVVADALAKNANDKELAKRLKNVGGGVVAGTTIDAVRALYRGAKNIKGVAPALAKALGIGAGAATELTPEEAQAGLLDKLMKPLIGKAGREAAKNPPAAFEARALQAPPPPGSIEALNRQWAPYKETDLFGNVPPKGVDFNFARMDTSDAAKEQINNISRAYAGQIKETTGGVIPHKLTRQVADMLGADPEAAERAIKNLPVDTEDLHVRALVMRDALVKAAEEVDKKALLITADPTMVSDAMLLEFREEVARFAALQANMKGVQTDIARALSAFRVPASGETGTLRRAQIANEALANSGGRSTAMELAEKWLKTPAEKKGDVATKGWLLKTRESVFEVWINGLLSSPRTHEVNFVSNNLFTLWQLPERAVAGAIGKARQMLPGADPDQVRTMEAAALLHGYIEAIPDAFRLGWSTFKSGVPSDQLAKIENAGREAISAHNWGLDESSLLGRFVDLVGTGVRIPGRMLMTADDFNKAIGKQGERRALAYRLSQQAMDEGKSVKEAAEVYADAMGGKIDAVEKSVQEFADTVTFTKELGEAGQWLQGGGKIPMFRVIMPFIRTPANILKETAKRSPLALAMPRSFWGEVAAGGARRDLALAKLSTGTAAMTYAANLAAEGKITGGGPTDPRLRKVWLETNRPYSVKIGDTWLPYGRLEPLGTLFGVAADYVEFRSWAPADIAEQDEVTLTGAAVGSILHTVSEKTWLMSLANLAEAVSDPERYAEQYIAKLAGSVVPFSSLVRDVAGAFDPAGRSTKSDPNESNQVRKQFDAMLNEIKSRTPGWSTDLPPRTNFWGEEIKRYDGDWWQAFNAFAPRKVKGGPVDEELLRLKYPLSEPSADIDGAKLTPHQYHALKLAMNEIKVPNQGEQQTMREYLNWLVQSGAYLAIPGDERKIDVLKDVRNKFVDVARMQMVTPGSPYFDADLFALVTTARVRKGAGLPARPR